MAPRDGSVGSAGCDGEGTVRGKIVDKATGEPVEFVNVVVTPKGSTSFAGGTII